MLGHEETSIFKLLRKHPTVFHNGGTTVHSQQLRVRVPVSPRHAANPEVDLRDG